MKCLKHQQEYNQNEYCVYCGKPNKTDANSKEIKINKPECANERNSNELNKVFCYHDFTKNADYCWKCHALKHGINNYLIN